MSFSKSRQSTFHAKIQEELLCGICLDFLSEPKVLSCAHSFCYGCLSQFVLIKKKTHKSYPLDLECPSCRQVTVLKTGSVDELSTNHNLKRLVDIVSEEEKKKTRDVIRRRELISPSIRQSPQSQLLCCKEHNKRLEYFCTECNDLICPKCIKHNCDHYQHKFEDIDDILPEHIRALRSLIQPACEVSTHAEQCMNDLYKIKNSISKNCLESIEEVEGTFKKISNSLECRKKAVISTVRKYSDIKLSRLDAHYQMLQNHHDLILEDVSKVEKMIENNENVTIISQKQILTERIEMHEQSIFSLTDMLKDTNSGSFLSFQVIPTILHQLDQLGELEEFCKEPDKSFHSVRRVVISDEEDPYNDVPLRFEDDSNSALRKEVRIDENNKHFQYEPENKGDETCTMNKEPSLGYRNAIKAKPHHHHHHPPTTAGPPTPPKPLKKIPHIPPKPDHLKRSYHTLPLANSTSLPKDEGNVSDSSEEYEPIDLPQGNLSQGNFPPPIPPNHPHREHPVPIPPKRSNSVPSHVICRYLSHTFEPEIIEPLMILESRELSGAFSNDIVYPNGVCYSSAHKSLIITDVNNHCIRFIDYDGKFVDKIGNIGRSGGQFKEPSAVTIDAKNFILICERDNQRVQKFTPAGKYVTKFGQKTLVGSQLNDPLGIAVSQEGDIAVSDWDKCQILFFNHNGKLVKSFGKDKNQTFLKFPAGITFNSNGNLLVVDRGNHCVWELNENGTIVNKIGCHGYSAGQLNYPYGITIGADHSIIVTESGNSRISIFSPTGKFIHSFGALGSKPGMFDHPRHVCVNSKRDIIVADEMNKRIQIFNFSY